MILHNACLRGRGSWRVDNVSLSLQPGEVLALLGPNGAGKSSLLKLLSGELPCARGRVMIGSADIRSMGTRQLALKRAVLPQESALSFNFKASDVVMMGRSPHAGCGVDVDQQVACWAMEMTDVLPLADQDYTRLSGGERQRVHLARVLAQIGPDEGAQRFLLLDEPTAALDLAHQHLILNLAKQLARSLNIGVLAILHDLNQAAFYADRIALLIKGRLNRVGAPSEVLTAETISNVFGVNASVLPHPRNASRRLVVTG